MSETYDRARLAILNHLLSFPTIRGRSWREDRTPEVGSLVALSSAPYSKWYLSWVVAVELGENVFVHNYLLRSVEDPEDVWWSNVCLYKYDQAKMDDHPEWRWSDGQFAFVDRWRRVCYKRNDAYITLPAVTSFHQDGSVTLSLRERHGGLREENQFHFEETFASWKKLTMKRMSEFYRRGCEVRKNWDAAA